MSEYIEHDQNGISAGLVEKKFYTFAGGTDAMLLESGRRFGPITLAYETCGTLSPARDNTILVLHALTGDSHVAGYYDPADPKPGWWEIMVGPDKPIDTTKYFVVCANVLGGCMGSTGPAAINPETGRPYGLSFPVVTIGDMVTAQKALIDHLGISTLLSVVGGSLGGMQVLEWCVRYPTMVRSAVPLATTSCHSALAIAFNEVARQAILADPNWAGGDYYDGKDPDTGLAVARMIGHITYLSDESMRLKFGRRLQDKTDFSFNFDADFQVESYLRYQGAKFVERFDANSFLYITKAADYFDLKKQHGNGSLVTALSKTGARFLVVSFTSDWLYPTYHSKNLVSALTAVGADVTFCNLQSTWGHDAFLLEVDTMTRLMSDFLGRIAAEGNIGLPEAPMPMPLPMTISIDSDILQS